MKFDLREVIESPAILTNFRDIIFGGGSRGQVEIITLWRGLTSEGPLTSRIRNIFGGKCGFIQC